MVVSAEACLRRGLDAAPIRQTGIVGSDYPASGLISYDTEALESPYVVSASLSFALKAILCIGAWSSGVLVSGLTDHSWPTDDIQRTPALRIDVSIVASLGPHQLIKVTRHEINPSTYSLMSGGYPLLVSVATSPRPSFHVKHGYDLP